jgi:hypothetical protein
VRKHGWVVQLGVGSERRRRFDLRAARGRPCEGGHGDPLPLLGGGRVVGTHLSLLLPAAQQVGDDGGADPDDPHDQDNDHGNHSRTHTARSSADGIVLAWAVLEVITADKQNTRIGERLAGHVPVWRVGGVGVADFTVPSARNALAHVRYIFCAITSKVLDPIAPKGVLAGILPLKCFRQIG